MSRASTEDIKTAVRFWRENPEVTDLELVELTGVSRRTANRVIAGQYALDPDQDVTEVPMPEPAPRPEKAGRPRRVRAPKRQRGEPAEDAVENLYTLSCMVAGVALAVMPARYQLTETDQEMILRPLSRMYLRRQTVPNLSPDSRDLITVAMGVFGYGVHAIGGRYAGRDSASSRSRPSAARTSRSATQPSAAPASPASNAVNEPAELGPNPYDPQVIMDQLEQELARAAAESSADDASMGSAGGPDA